MAKYNYVKLLTNIPEFITFQFNEPREFDSTFKQGEKVYSYGVEWKGDDAFLTATPTLNNLLKGIGKLEGKTIQLLKYEDGNKKMWKIMDEQGNDITPPYTGSSAQSGNIPQTAQKPHLGANLKPQSDLKQKEWALKVVADIKNLEARIKEAEDNINGLIGALIGDENLQAFEFHKGITRGVEEAFEKKSKSISTEKGFVNEEGVEIRTDIE